MCVPLTSQSSQQASGEVLTSQGSVRALTALLTLQKILCTMQQQRQLPILIKQRFKHLQILYKWSATRFTSLARMDLICINDRRWLNIRTPGCVALHPLLNIFILFYLLGSSVGDLWCLFWKRDSRSLTWTCRMSRKAKPLPLYFFVLQREVTPTRTVTLLMPSSHRLLSAALSQKYSSLFHPPVL